MPHIVSPARSSAQYLLRCHSTVSAVQVKPLKTRWVIEASGTSPKTSCEKQRRLGVTMKFANGKARKDYMNFVEHTSSGIPEGMEIVQSDRNEINLKSKLPDEDVVNQILNKLQTSKNFAVHRPAQCTRIYKMMVEFASPNIAKPLHMGHLRSAVTGNFVARINKAVGHYVHSYCFLGDWGTQFGLLQAGLKSANVAQIDDLELHEFTRYYVDAVKKAETDPEFKELSRKNCLLLEQRDPELLRMWRSMREITLKHLNDVWKDLDISFDVVQGESEYVNNTEHLTAALSLLTEKGLLLQDETGCKYANVKKGKNSSEDTRVILLKSDGTTLYLLRDVCAALDRKDKIGFERLIYVVDSSQSSHFLALFELLSRLGRNENMTDAQLSNFQHVGFGRVGGQSTRTGTFSLLADVIRDGQEKMQKRRMESQNTRNIENVEIAKKLAVSALIVNSLRYRRNKNIDFDWDECLRSDGDTGVNLQYNHARLSSLLDKHCDLLSENINPDCHYILSDPVAMDLLLELANRCQKKMRRSHSNLSAASTKILNELGNDLPMSGSVGPTGDSSFSRAAGGHLAQMKGLGGKLSRSDPFNMTEYSSTGVSSGSHARISRSGSHSQIHSGYPRSGDKTICEYCGLSYLTISEMRALQTKVKDQDERLNQLKEAVSENTSLKETLASLRKTHRKEITKREEECHRWMTKSNHVEKDLEVIKREFKELQCKNTDILQKLGIASEDAKQQEELISQLRRKLQSAEISEAEANGLKARNKQLEESLTKVLQQNKKLKDSSTHNQGSILAKSQDSPTEIALKAKVAQLTERCNRLEEKNHKLLSEMPFRSEESQARFSSVSTERLGSTTGFIAEVSSVVTVEVHDLKRENAILNSRLQAIADEHSNCHNLHSFLRESIEKLKTDNSRVMEDLNGIKAKHEESLLKVENLQAVISGYQAERNRFMNSYKEQQSKMEQMAAQNRAFHKSCDPKVIDLLKNNISTLQRQLQSIQSEKDRQQLEFEGRIAEAQREVMMEKERADSCLTQSLKERDEVEKRWQERWAKHHTKMNDQLEILKTNYEGSLQCAKAREEGLQKEMKTMEEQHERNRAEWEASIKELRDEVNQWSIKFAGLEEELQTTIKGKVEVEVMFQEKSKQLEELQEALRQGCEERQDLQRRTVELERSIQDTAIANSGSAGFCFPSRPIDSYGDVFQEFEFAKPFNSTESLSSSQEQSSMASWKQSQNLSAIKLGPLKPTAPRQQVKTENLPLIPSATIPLPRQRPNSPFPLLCKKTSAPTFLVGNGKSSKGSSHVSFKDKCKTQTKADSNTTFSITVPKKTQR